MHPASLKHPSKGPNAACFTIMPGRWYKTIIRETLPAVHILPFQTDAFHRLQDNGPNVPFEPNIYLALILQA